MRVVSLSLLALAVCGLVPACGGGDSGDGGGSTASCVPTSPDCYVTDKSGPGAECLAKFDNTGQTKWMGRITDIDVQGPAALTNSFIQKDVIDKGISLNQPKTCYEGGLGTFDWMFEIDSTTSTIHTGGGLPVTDPKAGGCYVHIPGALEIKPIDAPITIDPDGKTFHASGIDVNVPIFATATDTSNPIILPLHEVKLDAVFNDDSHNCIGRFNGPELDPVNNCQPDTSSIPPQRAWTTGAQLSGYIRVDEADQVFIDTANETLCALLAGISFKGPDGHCQTSTKWTNGDRPAGDWCAGTNQAADSSCSDAWELKGNFAVAAFKVNGDCP
jgi:hypothetical protein